MGLRWCIGGSLPLQISLGNHRLVGLRWYIGGSLTLQISLENYWLVGLRWYTLVGANPKVLGKILNKPSLHTAPVVLVNARSRSVIRRTSGLGDGYILFEEDYGGASQRKDHALSLLLVSQSSLPSDTLAPSILPVDNQAPSTHQAPSPQQHTTSSSS